MPYKDERAGLDSIRALVQGGAVDAFKSRLKQNSEKALLPLPKFEPVSSNNNTGRRNVLAIDGSNIYERIPGALPCTEAGLVTLGMALIDVEKIRSLSKLTESGAVNPRDLANAETGQTLGTVLPGMNATTIDGLSPRTWFRQTMNENLESASLGGENFAETLFALTGGQRTINCPDMQNCKESNLPIPKPGKTNYCPSCNEEIFTADALRIHDQFEDNHPAGECHSRFRDALELLALLNVIRCLSATERGIVALTNIAFVLDGPLAAFGTIAFLAGAVRKELRNIQSKMDEVLENDGLLVMSGIKSGPFVEHAEELDRDPAPNSRIPNSHYWLPNDNYIRKNIVAGVSKNSKPWGELTYFGRPVIFKTDSGRRLVLNVAQPESNPPLTEADNPRVLNCALAIADELGVGEHQFLPLRRAHASCAIPLKIGTDIIGKFAK